MKTFKQHITELTMKGSVKPKHSEILSSIRSIEKKVVDQELDIKKLVNNFKPVIKQHMDALIQIDKSPAVSVNTCSISAFFDDTADEDETQYEIVFVFNPNDKTIRITKDYWDWLINELADVMVHEMIHQGQAQSRSYVDGNEYLKGTTKDQKYYGKPDEIEAYAMNASMELQRKFKNPKSNLQNITSIGNDISPSIKRYLDTFQSPDHPVMKKFLKKVYQFLD